MDTHLHSLLKKAAYTSYFLGVIFLVLGVLMAAVYYPARAAGIVQAESLQLSPPQQACTAPPDWNQTLRLYYERQVTREWSFDVEEPEMDVELEFFYYQDYNPEGCPFDCSAGDCQTDEIGECTSPFGDFEVADGTEGINSGTVLQSGRLTQGSYSASFSVTGKGSINIGLRIHKKSVPPTPVPDTATPTPMKTATPTQTELPPVSTETPTPTATATPTDNVLPPVGFTATPTSTPETPTGITPTATPTELVNPPLANNPTPTATPTDEVRPPRPRKTSTPPPTLPPPSAATPSGQSPVLVPVTGGDLAALDAQNSLVQGLFLKLGAALIGLALIFHGVGVFRIGKNGKSK
jgi:hypothetical protein